MQKILIADDEKAIRAVLEKFLTIQGYDVLVAEDGLATIEKIKSCDFNLLIVDLKMPQADFGRIILELRERKKDVPVIILTGSIDAEQSEELKKWGYSGSDVLVKPAGLDVILAKIREKLPASL